MVYVALGSRAMVPGLVVIFGKWVKGMLLQKSRDETMAPRTTKSNLRVACEPPLFLAHFSKLPAFLFGVPLTGSRLRAGE